MREYSVLLVDDDINLLQGLKRALRKEPVFLTTANSAEKAIDELNAMQYDAIISDNWMDGMGGTELLRWVEENYPGTSRILLTGQPELARFDKTDADYFCVVAKPVDGKRLAEIVVEACQAEKAAKA